MTLRLRPSTSSRSRYSRRSVCNRRSNQEASGPPRGMLSISPVLPFTDTILNDGGGHRPWFAANSFGVRGAVERRHREHVHTRDGAGCPALALITSFPL